MKRAIIVPAPLAPAALADLKDWLGITTSTEDTGLAALLRAALETCEAFTGTLPLQATCEEVLYLSGGWLGLASRPVQAITGVQGLLASGTRVALGAADFAIDLGADGSGRVRVIAPGLATRVAVRFTAGLAADWARLPDGLRHGVIRLAAHAYRQREAPAEGAMPPAAVAVLWRPWRGVRLL